jgi:hypothetical protein
MVNYFILYFASDEQGKQQHFMATRSSSRKRKLTYKAQELEKKEKTPAFTSPPSPLTDEDIDDEDLANIIFASEVPVKRGRGRPRKVKVEELEDSVKEENLEDCVKRTNTTKGLTQDGLMNSFENVRGLVVIDFFICCCCCCCLPCNCCLAKTAQFHKCFFSIC